ncbi:tRNA (adenosine(37)-N6)-dimethylallyltransferase MiaA [Zavarzinia sp. CC-PAN008]|uniref:tRNA (adenosine(37)-N6)-dimethylallyltransferase MiaA n=1 Tax=Zavarzinia sp. CC-PAN008 TaxID=3243332 RepID=UPI003F7427E8
MAGTLPRTGDPDNSQGAAGPPAILLAGPTASGKSRTALVLAQTLGGTIINCDSMQVYRELRILTARPPPQDEAAAPHRLYGSVPAAQVSNVASWRADALKAIAEARAAGRWPILVGGTGLYFGSLLGGLAEVPEIPPPVRARVRAWGEEGAPLHDLLRARDPALAARLEPGDRQRILRGLEVWEATGRSLLDLQRAGGLPALPGAALGFVLAPPRDVLLRRIERRVVAMVEEGAREEVMALLALRLDPALPAMRALGVAQFAAHLRGELTLAQAIEAVAIATRQYAKRQMTWFRGRMLPWSWIDAQHSESYAAEILSKLPKGRLTPGF